jgi:hypothetical protein
VVDRLGVARLGESCEQVVGLVVEPCALRWVGPALLVAVLENAGGKVELGADGVG